MMVNLYRTFDQPLSHGILYEWHRMLTNGRNDLNEMDATERTKTRCKLFQVRSIAPRFTLKRLRRIRCSCKWMVFLNGSMVRKACPH